MLKSEDEVKKLNKYAYNAEYLRENYRHITVNMNKNTGLFERLERMQSITGQSRNSLILQAISEFLRRNHM